MAPETELEASRGGTSFFSFIRDAGATRCCCGDPCDPSGRYSQSVHREAGRTEKSGAEGALRAAAAATATAGAWRAGASPGGRRTGSLWPLQIPEARLVACPVLKGGPSGRVQGCPRFLSQRLRSRVPASVCLDVVGLCPDQSLSPPSSRLSPLLQRC